MIPIFAFFFTLAQKLVCPHRKDMNSITVQLSL